jgi:tetratricopeptide (TPR) repeat protein
MGVLAMLQQVLSITLLTAMAAVHPVPSQGIPRGASISGGSNAAPAPKVTVATPYPSNSADSASAVIVGYGLRDKLTRNLGGDWQVISVLDMNKNLANSGYPKDALLPPDQARALAVLFGTRVLVTTSMSKGADAHFVANTRVIGISDDAGQVVKATQAPGQQLNDFGSKMADQLSVIFKAYTDAKACKDQQTTNRVKAIDAANKALKQVPNYGFAEYCLGEIAQQKDSASDEVLQHFKNAALGDPFSLKAANQLAFIHIRRHDSTAVVADFQQMITIAPTNRPLAEMAINVFRQYHRPDAAEQVVDAQMKLDPTSPDWPDLKGNSCAAQAAGESDPVKAKPKFDCAYAAFSQEYQLEPSRADSLLFQKLIFVAQNTADSTTWARRWVQKYPTSVSALEVEAQLFTAAGQTDSAIAIVNMLTRLDSTESKPVLVVAKALIDAKHPEAALQFVPYFKKYGDETAKNQFAGLLITAIQPLAQLTPRPDSMLIILGQGVIDVAPTAPNYLIYGNYFMAVGLADQLAPLSTALRQAKTCDAAKAEDALLSRLEPALTVAATSSTAGIVTFAKDLADKLPPEKTFVAGMIKESCK